MKLSLGKKIAGAAVAGAVLVGAGTMAYAATTGGSTSSTTSPAAATAPAGPTAAPGKAADRVAKFLKDADHGTVEVKVKSPGASTATWQTFTFDRGIVTSVSAASITLARPDGQSVTLTIGAATKYRGVSSWQGIVTAEPAVVVSENGGALIVAQRKESTGNPGTGTTPSTASAA